MGLIFNQVKPKRTFKEMFEIDEDTGSFLYLTTACMDRHTLSRDEQELPEEIVGDYGNIEWQEEQFNINCAYQLKSLFNLTPKGDLKKFVSNFKHLLSDDMVERKEIYERIKGEPGGGKDEIRECVKT